MDTDKEIFDGKTFASLAKDIYFNSTRKSAQIDQLIKDLRTMIKDAGSAFEFFSSHALQFESFFAILISKGRVDYIFSFTNVTI